jgi:hypothetical protein
MSYIPTQEQVTAFDLLSPKGKKEVCRNLDNFLMFFSYFFIEYIKFPFAQFHVDFANDLKDLYEGKITELAWITSRETAKSSIAQAFLLWLIVYHSDEYYNVDSYDTTNAETFLFEVIHNLQKNTRVIQVYGSLFNAPRSFEEKTKKQVSDFITNNNIRVEAHSTQTSVRGRKHGAHRPSWLILDDYETLTTVRSEAATLQVAQHFEEFATGLDQKKARILYLSNYLSETANVARIIERSKTNDKLRVRKIPRIDHTTGLPTWPERDVLTDAELLLPQNANKVSIESKRKELHDPETGDSTFEREYQLQPVDPMGDGPDQQGYMALFPKDQIRITQSAFVHNPPHVIGVDPAGSGDDKSAIVVRSAFQAKVYALEKTSTPKSLAMLVLAAMRDYSVNDRSVVIDAFGVGFKVVQELSLLGHNVMAVNVGEKERMELANQDMYLNDRAYAYFMLKEWMAAGGEIVYNEVWKEQFKCIRYRTSEKQVRQIIPKKEIIKRGYKSPDAVDALALSMLAATINRGKNLKTADSTPISRFL